MGPDLQKFRKNRQISRFFEGEKSLDMGWGFRPRAAHPRQKIIRIPPRDFTSGTIIFHHFRHEQSIFVYYRR